ncbi:MAG: sulfatase, partial [Planctomycetes bacterium]|nr:sulfatase [Planctomycetota bacterium]
MAKTLLLALALGALVGLIEGWSALALLGLGFTAPGAELVGAALPYAGLAVLCLPIALAMAIVLRLPHKQPAHLAGWASLGLAWIIFNWWMQGEYFRRIPILRPLPLAVLLGSSALLFALHWGLRSFVRKSPISARNTLISALIFLPLIGQFAFQKSTKLADVPDDAGELPDITVVVIDTLRADHLGTYGYQREDGERTSPIIDSLAETGVVFEHTWSQAPWTRPSMASLHSGLFCTGHTVNQVYDLLPEGAITLAEMANARGYRTAGFSANANVGVTYGFGQGFEKLWTVGKKRTLTSFTRWGELQHFFVNKVMNQFLYDGADHAALVNEQTFAWWNEIADDPRPKFTYVHYIDPHTPYDPPEGGWLFKGDRNDLEPLGEFIMSRGTGKVSEYPFGAYPNPGQELIDRVIRMYDAEIRYVDQEFGKLLGQLRKHGLLDEGDWLFLTSDHGEEFYERGRWGHGQSLFEEQVHVPLIVIGPQARPGARQAQEVNLLDVHQTIAEVVGYEWRLEEGVNTAPAGNPTPSLSLLPLMAGEPKPEYARLLYAERLQDNVELRAARKDFLKIIDMPNHAETTEADLVKFQMWFDLRANPGELLGLELEQIRRDGSP